MRIDNFELEIWDAARLIRDARDKLGLDERGLTVSVVEHDGLDPYKLERCIDYQDWYYSLNESELPCVVVATGPEAKSLDMCY